MFASVQTATGSRRQRGVRAEEGGIEMGNHP